MYDRAWHDGCRAAYGAIHDLLEELEENRDLFEQGESYKFAFEEIEKKFKRDFRRWKDGEPSARTCKVH